MDHDLNVIGALVVVLGDRIRDGTEEASGMRGALPAALSALHEWAGGRTIETLAGGLRLSHSRTVRVVDRLEQQGLARRAPDPADGRGVLVHLTPAGRSAARACSTRGRPRWRRRWPGPTGAHWLRSPSGCSPGRRRAGAPPGRLQALRRARLRAPRRPLPGHARGRRGGVSARVGPRSIGRRQRPFAVVLPDERLQVMSEQAAGRDIVVLERARYGLEFGLGPVYVGVEMAHAAQR